MATPQKATVSTASTASTATAEEQAEMDKWNELELTFLNEWMNRRLWKRWEHHLQDTSRHKGTS